MERSDLPGRAVCDDPHPARRHDLSDQPESGTRRPMRSGGLALLLRCPGLDGRGHGRWPGRLLRFLAGGCLVAAGGTVADPQDPKDDRRAHAHDRQDDEERPPTWLAGPGQQRQSELGVIGRGVPILEQLHQWIRVELEEPCVLAQERSRVERSGEFIKCRLPL